MRIRTIDIETYEKQDDKLVPILNAREFTLGGLKKDTGGYYEFESKKYPIVFPVSFLTKYEIKGYKQKHLISYSSLIFIISPLSK